MLQVDLGRLMLLGGLVALPVSAAAYALGKALNRRHTFLPTTEPAHEQPATSLPPLALSVLPVAVPVLLIAARSAIEGLPAFADAAWSAAVRTAGHPPVALACGIALCLPLLKRNGSASKGLLDAAVTKTGTVLLLTAAGGAFGEVIKGMNLGTALLPALASGGWGLAVPFAAAALLKTAQGSSTVAVVSAAGILGPLLPGLGFESESARALALLAMGAGSMVVSHTNDSYFWVVAQFSGVPPDTALKTYSLATAVMGAVALASVWALQWLL
jgi:GntP family gluconate:H+ symporter